MRAFVIFIIAGLGLVMGAVFFPPLRFIFGTYDTSTYLPLAAAAQTALPYAFLFFVGYAIHKQACK